MKPRHAAALAVLCLVLALLYMWRSPLVLQLQPFRRAPKTKTIIMRA
jgi:hypothetical protein